MFSKNNSLVPIVHNTSQNTKYGFFQQVEKDYYWDLEEEELREITPDLDYFCSIPTIITQPFISDPKIEVGKLYRNSLTGYLCQVIKIALDTSEQRCGEKIVIYHNFDDVWLTCGLSEFKEKFVEDDLDV